MRTGNSSEISGRSFALAAVVWPTSATRRPSLQATFRYTACGRPSFDTMSTYAPGPRSATAFPSRCSTSTFIESRRSLPPANDGVPVSRAAVDFCDMITDVVGALPLPPRRVARRRLLPPPSASSASKKRRACSARRPTISPDLAEVSRRLSGLRWPREIPCRCNRAPHPHDEPALRNWRLSYITTSSPAVLLAWHGPRVRHLGAETKSDGKGSRATCSPKTAPPGMRVDSARMPAGRPRDEAQAIHRGADHRDPEGGRGGSEEHRPLPAPRDQRADVLSLES